MTSDLLGAEDLVNINAALDAIRRLKTEVKRAEQAQIPLTVTLVDLEAQEKQLLAIKRVYFPGH